jgi:protease I
MGDYYRTYLDKTVESEVRTYLAAPSDFLPGPWPISRDTPDNLSPAFVVRDGFYISARWPGDIHKFSVSLLEALKEKAQAN